MICIGCGTKHLSELDCPVCYARLARCLDVFKHWPLETSLTPAALEHVQAAIELYLDSDEMRLSRYTRKASYQEVENELTNLAAIIRAYLQHVAAGMRPFSDEPSDEELLA
jgi:hypothetical protein